MMKFNCELLNFYKKVSLRYKLYTIIRYAICPFEEIEKFVPAEGRILDCGCGHGIFSNLLAMKSDKRYVIGMDINENKIKIANSALEAGNRNVEFKVGDLMESGMLKNINCVTFIDVLCYVPLDEKRKLLKKIYDNLPVGGVLIIKSMQEFPRWKYWLILFHMLTVDKLIHKNLGGNTYFVKNQQYLNLLKGLGFEAKCKDINKGYPYPDCLYICTKNN